MTPIEEAPRVETAPGAESERITPAMVTYLRQTRPWTKLISILGFVACGVTLFLGVEIMAMGSICLGGTCRPIPPLFGIFNLISSLALLIPAIYLFKYGAAIGRMGGIPGPAPAMEEALRHQRTFWAIWGILTLVSIVIYLGAFFGGRLAGLFS